MSQASDDKPDYGLKFYGRRKGKPMRTTKQEAYDQLLPVIRIDCPDGTPAASVEPRVFFGNAPEKFWPEKIWMEIGFGDGEHLLHQAINNPGIGMIGCEPFINGIAALCAGIRKHKLTNIRVWPDDARKLLTLLKPASLDRLFLLNSDPWPKTRHHKRRFIQKETLDEISRLLKPGAPFRMSSDHASLTAWQLEKAYFHGSFDWLATDAADWSTRPADLPETRYQNKGAQQGRPTVFLNFARKTSAA